ncbi:MAG: hypothetical protein ACD_49C00021G0023 [uncultured bacterium (gcode 4)]|uniref:Uncharacterized protein n=1 Tax=uncultured bacterium (gcode 4) TaxID=1234023 RepID=K2BD83_9BACT|nr:MAG: hypothetical protein ACD_49C00021G0023 [uncultured bacterium (gcode 4)]
MVCLEWRAVLTRNRNDKAWKPTTISDYTLSRKQQDKRLAALGNFDVLWAWIGEKPEVLAWNEVEKNKGIIAKILGILK